jgi:hypothetical protein
MWKDPIVEEVWAIRERIAEECGYNIRRLLERDRQVLKDWTGNVVTKKELLRMRPRVRRG